MIAAFNGHAKVVKGLLDHGHGDVDAVGTPTYLFAYLVTYLPN